MLPFTSNVFVNIGIHIPEVRLVVPSNTYRPLGTPLVAEIVKVGPDTLICENTGDTFWLVSAVIEPLPTRLFCQVTPAPVTVSRLPVGTVLLNTVNVSPALMAGPRLTTLKVPPLVTVI